MPVTRIDELESLEDEKTFSQNSVNKQGGNNIRPLPSRAVNASSNGGGSTVFHCSMKERIEALETNDERILKDITSIKQVLGSAPDPIAGTPGTGMSSLLFKIANAVVKDRQKLNSFPDADEINSLSSRSVDFDEGEVTKVQNRNELLIRAKVAESDKVAAEKALEAYKQAHIDSRNELQTITHSIETQGKIKIEKWKLILGAVGLFFGPGVISAVIQHGSALVNYFFK